MSNFDMNYE